MGDKDRDLEYKGIILAGGYGTRLRPLTDFMCKPLLPVYDKPLIYYPLTTMIMSGIKEILIISTPKDLVVLKEALGDGSKWGISLKYAVEEEPKGIPEAFVIGEEFIDSHPTMLMLGDNILHKGGITPFLKGALESNKGGSVFGYPVSDPHRFGIAHVDGKTNNVIGIEEKPVEPKSNLAVIGLYLYDETVCEKAKSLRPSNRGEKEITDINKLYLREDRLGFHRLSRGDFWIDVGVFDAFSDASQLIRLTESHLGLKLGCPEEASYIMRNINLEQLKKLSQEYLKSPYGQYLQKIVKVSGQ